MTKNVLPRVKKLLHFHQVNFKENFVTVSIVASLTRSNNFRCVCIPRPLGSAGAEVKGSRQWFAMERATIAEIHSVIDIIFSNCLFSLASCHVPH